MHQVNKPESAATDVGEFITDLDGGMFDRMLSIALSQSAAAVIDHGKKAQVVIKLDIERIPGTQQVRLAHGLKFTKPTGTGKSSEETDGATVLYVGKFGALSLAQPSLLDPKNQRTLDA